MSVKKSIVRLTDAERKVCVEAQYRQDRVQ